MVMAMTIITEQDLQTNNDEVYWGADKEQYLFSEAFHDLKIKQITHSPCGLLLTKA
jgi:hypothetical protein